MKITVIHKRSGMPQAMDERSARILVALGKANYADAADRLPSQEYQTRAMTAETQAKRGPGRPRKAQ